MGNSDQEECRLMQKLWLGLAAAIWLGMAAGCGSDKPVAPVEEPFGVSTVSALVRDVSTSSGVISPVTAAQAQITFSVYRAASGSVWICQLVEDQYTVVRTLLEDSGLNPGRYAFMWDGLDDAGAPVPAGQYTVFIVLVASEQERQVERATITMQWNTGQ